MRFRTVLAAGALLFSTLTLSAKVSSDLNGDGKSDLVLQNTSSGAVAVWLMNGDAVIEKKVVATPAAGWQVVATGDLDNDGKSDIVAENSDGTIAMWKMDGTTRVSETTIAKPAAGWKVIGTRDVTGDGKDDIFLQNANGSLAIWDMNGAKLTAGHPFGTTTDCAIALGNFGGNGLLLYNGSNKTLQRKLASNASLSTLDEGSALNAFAVGDFDGDGRDDLVEQLSNGAVKIQSFGANGEKSGAASAVATADAGWQVIGTGDYDGNGRSDILLYSTTGGVALWQMNGATIAKRGTLALDAGWKPLALVSCAQPDAHAGHASATTPVAAAPYAGKGSKVTFASSPGDAMGYLSLPKGTGKKPAIIVIQEWWGLNDWIRQQTDRFAAQGDVALAVDLYRGRSTSNPDEAHELMRGMPEDRAIADLKAAFNYLAARKDVDPKRIAVIGWCMGGGYSLGLALAEPRVAATVINYGRLVTDPASIAKIQSPILGNFGAADRGIPPADVRAFDAALKAAGKSSDIRIYEGAGHGFMNPNNTAGYVYESTEDAWKRIDGFLAKWLGRS
ncbi:MAG: carboxymethylenebutenolidase [Acidobacteriota bacterium]|jgi:carboxymethylenebutenolidase|nr:carboxymethylenebutenolidase [Acidobacteriota bacterium]